MKEHERNQIIDIQMTWDGTHARFYVRTKQSVGNYTWCEVDERTYQLALATCEKDALSGIEKMISELRS